MRLSPENGLQRPLAIWARAILAYSVLSAAPLFAQQATFGGTVLSSVTEKPVVGAEIVVTDLNRTTRSDSAGNFIFSSLPAGTHRVTVRMVGFESLMTEISVTGAQSIEADLILTAGTQQLATVDVTAEAASPYASRLREFDERRHVGSGRYLTNDVFEQQDGRPVSAIISGKMSGVKILQSNGRRWLASNRGSEVRLGGAVRGSRNSADRDVPRGCYMQVVVNGVVRYNGSAGQTLFDIDQLETKDILGVEIYTTASTPVQYGGTQGAGACGTVIVWTKRS